MNMTNHIFSYTQLDKVINGWIALKISRTCPLSVESGFGV